MMPLLLYSQVLVDSLAGIITSIVNVSRNIRRFVFAHMANRCGDNLIEFAKIVQHTIFVSDDR